MPKRASVRYYSEREQLFPVPEGPMYEERDGVVYVLPRDTRMMMSVEWAAEHGIPVPEDWRDYQ